MPPITETRGDFHYDAEGNFISLRQATLPEDFERVPMSHLEKF